MRVKESFSSTLRRLQTWYIDKKVTGFSPPGESKLQGFDSEVTAYVKFQFRIVAVTVVEIGTMGC